MPIGGWFHCFSGIAGDMALGSLLAAGADVEAVRAGLASIDITGWSIDPERVQKNGVGALHAGVTATDEPHPHRSHATIRHLIEQATLPTRVVERALAVFAALADAEAEVHGVDVDDVHFHEVGGVDALVDVVGTCLALEDLGVDQVSASPVALGTGTINASHGVLPNPAPAVVRLLVGAPTYGLEHALELTTPTGAAILRGLGADFGPMPAFSRIRATGFGAGTKDLPGRPNAVQVVIGELAATPHLVDANGPPAVVLETNVDDCTGEVLAHTLARLMAAGAHDTWLTPILMKKGRPGYTVHVLADPTAADALAAVLTSETGSLGVRMHAVQRWPAERSFSQIALDGGAVALKTGPHRTKAEFDDAATVALATGRAVRDVIDEAEANHAGGQARSAAGITRTQ